MKIANVAKFVESKVRMFEEAHKKVGSTGPSSALRDRLGVPPPAAGAAGAAPAAGASSPPAVLDDEVRTLWADTDDHGIQRKEWRKVLVESYHELFAAGEGQLLTGPASTLALMRLMEPSPRECYIVYPRY